MAKTHGRHTPAFLLLLLTDGPSYGAQLLARLQSELPHCRSDSAIVYRSLTKLEGGGFVQASWLADESGRPRKWYSITESGKAKLAEYADDIEHRVENLRFFLDRYSKE